MWAVGLSVEIEQFIVVDHNGRKQRIKTRARTMYIVTRLCSAKLLMSSVKYPNKQTNNPDACVTFTCNNKKFRRGARQEQAGQIFKPP